MGGVALALFLGLGLTIEPRDVRPALIGQAAPAFTLAQLQDPRLTLTAADMKGQVWLLNIWASWCAPCRDEHPLLVRLAREEAVAIVGLNYKDDPRAAQEWLLHLGDPYRVSIVDRDGLAAIDYGVDAVPATIVIDQAGIVRLKHVGPLTQALWTRDVQPLLSRLRG